MIEKYILEARWLDKINRCKKSTIVASTPILTSWSK